MNHLYDKIVWHVNTAYNRYTLKKARAETHGYHIYGRILINNKGGVLRIGPQFLCNSGLNYNTIGQGDQTRLLVDEGASLTIGKKVGISNSTIVCSQSISIGDHALIGGGCCIWDTDFHSADPAIRKKDMAAGARSAPISIEDNVFIGAATIVLKGVTIGQNSVIGAGSVVTKSIPKNEIWGGSPARFIRAL